MLQFLHPRQSFIAIAFSVAALIGSSCAVAQNEAGFLFGVRSEVASLVVKENRLRKITVNVCHQDEVWKISGRSCHLTEDVSLMKVKKLCENRWEESSLDQLVNAHSTDKTKTTLLYIHGNRTNESWAIARGLQFYNNVFCKIRCPRPAVRFVIFSWCSEKDECRPLREFDQKSNRAIAVGRAVSNLLNEFSDRKMMLSGFSLGTQVILSALKKTAQQCGDPNHLPGKYRVALIAPALDGRYAAQQQFESPAQCFVARTEVFDNHRDRALRVSKFARRKQAPSGDVSISQLAQNQNLSLGTVRVRDVGNVVGKCHSVNRYTSHPAIVQTVLALLGEVGMAQEVAVPNFDVAPTLAPTLAPTGASIPVSVLAPAMTLP